MKNKKNFFAFNLNFNASYFSKLVSLTLAAFILAFSFSLILLSPIQAKADGSYFNRFYVGINGGLIQTSPSGLSSKTGSSFNITAGKNYNFNHLILGVDGTLGYASNGSWTTDNFDGLGDNVDTSIYSVYYSAAIKAGYAVKNLMPFVKLGYIGYTYAASSSYSGPYGNFYESYTTPVSDEGGVLYGAGVEYMFNKEWGITAQYYGTSLSGSDRTNNYTIGLDFNF